MKKYIYIAMSILFALLFWQCENIKDWTEVERDNIPPGTISNPVVINTPGGAMIAYVRPGDKDLLAVKAVYSFTEGGKILEAFSSAFSDMIMLEGFPDTKERIVRLISVDESMNESAPVEVTIQPLTPPIEQIYESLKMESVFGGVLVTWENPTRTPIGISLFYADSETGDMTWDYTYYSQTENGVYAFRGHDATETKFQAVVRDRWENFSQPVETVLTPLQEVPIFGRDENGQNIWIRYGFSFVGNNLVSSNPECIYRGDLPRQYNSVEGVDKLNDGHAGDANNNSRWLHTGDGSNVLEYYTGNPFDNNTVVLPMYLTIDMVKPCKLSRHKLFHRGTAPFSGHNLRHYELWGTNQTPKSMSDFVDEEGNPDVMASLAYWTSWEEIGGTDAWKDDGWVRLSDCWTVAPISGTLNLGEVTEADRQEARENGFEFDVFPECTGTTVRYIRIVSDKNWSEGSTINIGEMQFWGDYVY